jgi:hypothetical protein
VQDAAGLDPELVDRAQEAVGRRLGCGVDDDAEVPVQADLG